MVTHACKQGSSNTCSLGGHVGPSQHPAHLMAFLTRWVKKHLARYNICIERNGNGSPIMQNAIDTAESLLRKRGFKLTPQRSLLLQVLAAQSTYLDAEEIYELAHAQDDSISLATVYRTLGLYAELALVDHRYIEPEHRREAFRMAEGPEQHYLTCMRCNKRVVIHADLLNRMAHELVRRKGVSVTSACACFTGYCPECTAELRAEGKLDN